MIDILMPIALILIIILEIMLIGYFIGKNSR